MISTIKAWLAAKGGFSHVAATVFAALIAAYAAVPAFHQLVVNLFKVTPSWLHEILLAAFGLYTWYKNTTKIGITTTTVESTSATTKEN